MTGISSRIGYTRRQFTHFNPPPPGFNSTFDLQAGHRSISRRSGLTLIAKRLVENESARRAGPPSELTVGAPPGAARRADSIGVRKACQTARLFTIPPHNARAARPRPPG